MSPELTEIFYSDVEYFSKAENIFTLFKNIPFMCHFSVHFRSYFFKCTFQFNMFILVVFIISTFHIHTFLFQIHEYEVCHGIFMYRCVHNYIPSEKIDSFAKILSKIELCKKKIILIIFIFYWDANVTKTTVLLFQFTVETGYKESAKAWKLFVILSTSLLLVSLKHYKFIKFSANSNFYI